MKILYLITIALIAQTSSAYAQSCKPGETRFNWKKMAEETCSFDSRYAFWQWGTCTEVSFPTSVEKSGNDVCRASGKGKCESVRHNREVEGVGVFNKEFDYPCRKQLYFSDYDHREICKPVQIPWYLEGGERAERNENKQNCRRLTTIVRCCK